MLRIASVFPAAKELWVGPEKNDSESEKQERSKGRGIKRKRDIVGKECAACGLSHELQNCYYVFPEKTPKNFRLRGNKRKEVEGKMQKNKDLERGQKTQRNPPPTIQLYSAFQWKNDSPSG